MNANPFSAAAFMALRRASGRFGAKGSAETMDTRFTIRRTTIAPSSRALRQPVQAGESGVGGSGRPSQDVLKSLTFAIEHGDRQAKVAAEALVYGLIVRAMTARLLDPRRGAVPGFVHRLRKSVESFEGKFH